MRQKRLEEQLRSQDSAYQRSQSRHATADHYSEQRASGNANEKNFVFFNDDVEAAVERENSQVSVAEYGAFDHMNQDRPGRRNPDHFPGGTPISTPGVTPRGGRSDSGSRLGS